MVAGTRASLSPASEDGANTDECLCSARFLLFVQSETPAQRMVPPSVNLSETPSWRFPELCLLSGARSFQADSINHVSPPLVNVIPKHVTLSHTFHPLSPPPHTQVHGHLIRQKAFHLTSNVPIDFNISAPFQSLKSLLRLKAIS